MGKPSIFSNDYEQRMRKRRKMKIINTILFLLIIISATYFGVNYYKEGNKIDFDSIFKNITGNIENNGNEPRKNNADVPNANNSSPQNNESEQTEEKAVSYYEYSGSDGKTYRLEYVETLGRREFTGVKSGSEEVQCDVSQDGSKIVFCTTSEDVVISDEQGKIKKINSDSYKSKSAGITIEKQATMKNYPGYVWAAKPHFTSDNRVVYITYLPYLKGANTFYMWVVSIDGSSQRMAGKLTNDMDRIIYDGYSADGALKIKVDDSILYLPVGGYKLVK